eukprot:SAG22_NODE_1135_length_5398_cov_3.581808_2_plen_313_part_00
MGSGERLRLGLGHIMMLGCGGVRAPEVLQWARANGCDWDDDTCRFAAGGGHLEVLQWARTNGCDWNYRTCTAAARCGHLEVLQWARANGCDWSSATCTAAARSGHLEVLQWARANGCDWSSAMCRAAAGCGHLEVLQWARANGCDWDSSAIERRVHAAQRDTCMQRWPSGLKRTARNETAEVELTGCVFMKLFVKHLHFPAPTLPRRLNRPSMTYQPDAATLSGEDSCYKYRWIALLPEAAAASAWSVVTRINDYKLCIAARSLIGTDHATARTRLGVVSPGAGCHHRPPCRIVAAGPPALRRTLPPLVVRK